MQDLAGYFEAESPLRARLPGFQPRAGQAWMAEAVAEAIENRARLIVEAGTGTGKTFAYLLPALLAGQKTIISTGTRALQDQLYHRDLPLVAGAIGRPVTTALLKGRANYLCLERLATAEATDARTARNLDRVRALGQRAETGDRSELTGIPEDSPVWPLVTSTVDNCLGQSCPQYEACHVVRARRRAQEADLVVVNHHLLLADLAMKEEGFVEFLPGADVVILDEAHQIPELATGFFGVSVGSREIERLADELRVASQPYDQPGLARRIDALQTATRRLRAEAPRSEGRHELSAFMDTLRQPLDDLRAAAGELAEALQSIRDATVELEKLAERLFVLGERLAVIASEDGWEGLRWLEVGARSLRLHLTPLDVAATLNELFSRPDQAWIFTSATLAVGEDFSYFAERAGIADARGVAFASPYAAAEQGLVYLPPGLPEPSDPEHTDAVVDAVLPVGERTRGGVFFLFTSHRALRRARQILADAPHRLGGRLLLAQGEAPRDELLRRFREAGNAILLGTGTFWEGVDVRGSALTVVAIDKLPFASPADPLMMARLEHIRRRGGNGFVEHQLPTAALALKQGAGRLLRDASDHGVVVLCDPRIKTRGYGSLFLATLSPMPVTERLSDVQDFFERHEPRPASLEREQTG